MIVYSRKIKEEAEKYNLPYVDTSHNFEERLQQCVQILMKAS